MFKLDKKIYKGNPTTELVANVVEELGHMFDVLKSAIDINRKRIVALEKRIKEMEDKNGSRNTN